MLMTAAAPPSSQFNMMFEEVVVVGADGTSFVYPANQY